MSHRYGLCVPGGLLNPGQLDCPFCKRPPTAKVLRVHNERGCALVRARNTAFDPTWLYGWCIQVTRLIYLQASSFLLAVLQCYKPSQYMEKVCARLDTPELKGFVCVACRDRPLVTATANRSNKNGAAVAAGSALASAADFTGRECPQCQVKCEKLDGCDHIT